ncbi:Hydrogenase transcriptional regulatory protein hupR1 [Vibrio cholerae]|nr:Hydrogenase transcriptional regulatory protein hupR1 [Vibrio cholerae]
MEKLNIICVDDQREVLSAVLQDLEPLSRWINIEDCESADEALELMDDLDAQGEWVAVVISDHVMPGKSGVELLSEISADPRFIHTKKVLLTGKPPTPTPLMPSTRLGFITTLTNRGALKPWWIVSAV